MVRNGPDKPGHDVVCLSVTTAVLVVIIPPMIAPPAVAITTAAPAIVDMGNRAAGRSVQAGGSGSRVRRHGGQADQSGYEQER